MKNTDLNKKKKIVLTIVLLLVVFAFIFIWKLSYPEHEFYCTKFMLTVDDQQIDLKQYDSEMSSVSELLLIGPNHLFIMGRVNESDNALMIYDFNNKEIIFNERGITLCWTNDDYKSCRFLVNDQVFDLDKKLIYEAPEGYHIFMIEYVEEFFKITLADLKYENFKEVWF